MGRSIYDNLNINPPCSRVLRHAAEVITDSHASKLLNVSNFQYKYIKYPNIPNLTQNQFQPQYQPNKVKNLNLFIIDIYWSYQILNKILSEHQLNEQI